MVIFHHGYFTAEDMEVTEFLNYSVIDYANQQFKL